MSFPKYEKYKDSGLEWLRDIPEHWSITRIKNIFTIGRGRVISNEEVKECGSYPVFSSQTVNNGCLGYIETFDFDCEQLTWTTDGANAGTVFIRNGKHNCTNVCGTLQVQHQNYNLRFGFYFLTFATQFYKRPDTNGAKIMNGEMAIIPIVIPIVSEQIQIVKFLDHETAKIDELVKEQERLIELLKEKRQAVISHAVTRGLDTNVKLKPSSIEWLGDIPEHWEIKKIKYLSSRISSGKTPLGGSEVYVDEGIIFLRSQNVHDDGLRLDDVVFIDNRMDEEMSVSRVVSRDILLNITGASIGRSCIVPDNFSPANVNQHVCVIRLCNSEYVSFVGWVFKAGIIKNQIDYAQNGAAREGLNFDQIGEMLLVMPPVKEQNIIANFLDRKITEFDILSAEANKAINLLQERRTALISAAVTGKIDVRQLNKN